MLRQQRRKAKTKHKQVRASSNAPPSKSLTVAAAPITVDRGETRQRDHRLAPGVVPQTPTSGASLGRSNTAVPHSWPRGTIMPMVVGRTQQHTKDVTTIDALN